MSHGMTRRWCLVNVVKASISWPNTFAVGSLRDLFNESQRERCAHVLHMCFESRYVFFVFVMVLVVA